MRQQFWIPQGKSLTRKIINNCLYCKRGRTEPKVPVMADLPRERLAIFEPPFTNTGVDYFGPVSVKRGRSTEKRWGCIFTCLFFFNLFLYKITLLTLLTVRAKYITRQYSILPTIQCLLVTYTCLLTIQDSTYNSIHTRQ